MYVNDRRANLHLPKPEDYDTPLTPRNIAVANKRFKLCGIPGAVPDSNRDKAVERIKLITRERRKGRAFDSVGDYLEHLNLSS